MESGQVEVEEFKAATADSLSDLMRMRFVVKRSAQRSTAIAIGISSNNIMLLGVFSEIHPCGHCA